MNTNLDPSQREAVYCGTGPCEIIAGPGSGKTTVLTERILYLLSHYHFDPSTIIVMTFSRSAASEMKDRFLKRADERGWGVRFGTFHSVFYHILLESAPKKYRLLSQHQKEELLRHLIANYYPDENERPDAEEIEKYLHGNGEYKAAEEIKAAIRMDYRTFLRENGYLDFDGMVSECRRLLTENGKIRRYWQKQFRAVLVDEFQDVSPGQYETLKLLTNGEGLFVVGDDDQSIYGFRGSSPGIMRKFTEDYPEADRIFLRRNYRCSGCVCRTADRLIRQNKDRISKTVQAVRPAGDRTVLRGFADDRDQLRYLARSLQSLSDQELSGTAVIVRTNAHVLRTEKYLSETGIRCSGRSAFGQPSMRTLLTDIKAYWSLSTDLRNGRLSRESLFRIMNRPERFLLRSAVPEESVRPEALLGASCGSAGSLRAIRELLRDLQILGSMDPEGFVRYLFGPAGYGGWALDHLGAKEEVSLAMKEILRESRSCREMETLLNNIAGSVSGRAAGQADGVRVMTMHVCKGLEFRRVYLPYLNEGIIPGRRCRRPEDLEEERRLLYVAMTRARDHLELLYVRGTEDNPRPPSRFLSVYGVRSFVYA